MNSPSQFTRSNWANGQPSIEVSPFDYSKAGLDKIVGMLLHYYSFEKSEVTAGLEKFMTAIFINGERVDVDMDNWTCSIAFQSESLRDEVFRHLESALSGLRTK